MNNSFISSEGFPYRIIGERKNYFIIYAYRNGYMRTISKRDVLCNNDVSFAYRGVGYVDVTDIDKFIEYHKSKVFSLWYGILSRVGKGNYKNVEICDEWKLFSNFKKFCDRYYNDGWVIDKDLLSNSNRKIYSAETCTFMPLALNSAIKEMGFRKIRFTRKSNCWCFFTNATSGKTMEICAGSLNEAIKLYAIYRCVRIQTIIDCCCRYRLRKEALEKIRTIYSFDSYYERLKDHLYLL